jgi:predicted flap endonuclease-1-like 5' DNA nuclease
MNSGYLLPLFLFFWSMHSCKSIIDTDAKAKEGSTLKERSTAPLRSTYSMRCPQDLSAVQGVGPIFKERLYAAEIGSYWTLAILPLNELTTILNLPPQIQGINMEAITNNAMILAQQSNSLGRAWNGSPPDDFDDFPGMGVVYKSRLFDAGICTYADMAVETPERLAEICRANHDGNIPDYSVWVNMAAERTRGEE